MIRTRWVAIVIMAVIAAGCAGTEKSMDGPQAEIIRGLSSKVRAIDAYAQDYVMDGMQIKRMYFQFEKDGRPFYRFREDLVRGGDPYVYIYNADGKHDFHYFPESKTACRCPTSGAWNESNYAKARDWHFPYDEAEFAGEMIVSGTPCYLLKMRGGTYAVSLETGLPLAKMGRNKDLFRAVTYENLAFDLTDDVFGLPPDATVTDRDDCSDLFDPFR